MNASKAKRPARATLMARERLEQYGPSVLADDDLIAIIAGANGHQTAAAVLEECGAVQQLPHESVHDLTRIASVTPRRAATIVAAVELGRRTLMRPAPETPRLGSPREVASYLLPAYGSHPVERFGIVSLNSKHRVLRTELISTGTLDTALAGPREIFRTATLHRAAAIVLFHNHPSGDPSPSGDDVALTARLCEAGLIFGIEVVDHVILANAKYCSFKEMGRI